MALTTFPFAADATTGAAGGDYVPAEVARRLEHSLSKLVWAVLYGKSYDASGLAVAAEQMLSELKQAKPAQAA